MYDSQFTAYEARVPQNFFFLLFFASQVGKCVDYNTKNKIEDNDDHDEIEQEVIDNTEVKQWFLQPIHRLTYATATNHFYSINWVVYRLQYYTMDKSLERWAVIAQHFQFTYAGFTRLSTQYSTN